MTKYKHIFVKNIYYMLSYAFSVLLPGEKTGLRRCPGLAYTYR